MLELDYAFLADFATIQDGRLTVVGASFTRMVVTEYPTFALLGVAGRIRCDEPDRNTINVTLRITSPGVEPTTIEAVNALDASEKTNPPYDKHRRGIVFAVQVNLPVLEEGTHTVEVDLDETDGVDRTLKFEVLRPQDEE
jgi:hypothetical protein